MPMEYHAIPNQYAGCLGWAYFLRDSNQENKETTFRSDDNFALMELQTCEIHNKQWKGIFSGTSGKQDLICHSVKYLLVILDSCSYSSDSFLGEIC